MTKLIGIAGSLRKASYNAALLRAAIELAPEHVEIEIGSINDIPLYNGDLETEQGIPDAVSALKDRIGRSRLPAFAAFALPCAAPPTDCCW